MDKILWLVKIWVHLLTTRRKTVLDLFCLYTRYPIVARALGLAAAFRPSASREQRYLAYNYFVPSGTTNVKKLEKIPTRAFFDPAKNPSNYSFMLVKSATKQNFRTIRPLELVKS